MTPELRAALDQIGSAPTLNEDHEVLSKASDATVRQIGHGPWLADADSEEGL
jgi:hypothetical protein